MQQRAVVKVKCKIMAVRINLATGQITPKEAAEVKQVLYPWASEKKRVYLQLLATGCTLLIYGASPIFHKIGIRCGHYHAQHLHFPRPLPRSKLRLGEPESSQGPVSHLRHIGHMQLDFVGNMVSNTLDAFTFMFFLVPILSLVNLRGQLNFTFFFFQFHHVV